MRLAFLLLAVAAALGIWAAIDGRYDGRTAAALLILGIALLVYRHAYLKGTSS